MLETLSAFSAGEDARAPAACNAGPRTSRPHLYWDTPSILHNGRTANDSQTANLRDFVLETLSAFSAGEDARAPAACNAGPRTSRSHLYWDALSNSHNGRTASDSQTANLRAFMLETLSAFSAGGDARAPAACEAGPRTSRPHLNWDTLSNSHNGRTTSDSQTANLRDFVLETLSAFSAGEDARAPAACKAGPRTSRPHLYWDTLSNSHNGRTANDSQTANLRDFMLETLSAFSAGGDARAPAAWPHSHQPSGSC